MYWRLKLDVPYDFATEPGFTKAVHCKDFRPDGDVFSDTWREPVTGLVMLKPSFLKRNWYENARPIADWLHNSDFWRASKRSVDLVSSFTTIKPAGVTPTLIDILIDLAGLAIESYGAVYDDLVWALQSNFLLQPDESFALQYFPIADELIRKQNWLAVMWDNIGIHFSQQGLATVSRYDRADLSATPEYQYAFEFANPSELAHRVGYLIFVPCPPLGLLFYHSHASPRSSLAAANAESVIARGHLIPWAAASTAEAYWRNFESSPVRVAINPYQDYHLTFFNIRFPTTGHYTDAPFDPGFEPTTDPSTVTPIVLTTQNQSATAALRKADNSAAWVAGTDRKGRVRTTLTSADGVLSPFVQGYGAIWEPVITSRDTTPVTCTPLEIEITDDELAAFEGVATVKAKDAAAIAICQRGDSTFLLENSADGVTWSTYCGGLAKHFDLEVMVDDSGTWYRVQMRLFSMHERLREGHANLQTAFDSVYPGDGVNVVLRGCGFAAMTVPAELLVTPIPPAPDGNGWRYAVREGDNGEDLVYKLLIYGRGQYAEWRMRWDWDLATWICEQRARDTSAGATWQLTPYSDDENRANRIVRVSSLRLEPFPPECNVLLVEGADRPDPSGTRLTIQVNNADSVTDDTSIDYLGRVITARLLVREVTDIEELKRMARRIERLAMHHAQTGTAEIVDYCAGLAPNVLVQPLDGEDVSLGDFWIKRRTLKIVGGFPPTGYQEFMSLSLDTIWEGDIPS